MKELEKQIKALANKRRLAIMKSLKNGKPRTVGNIADEIKLSFKATSKHLGILYAVGMIEKEQASMSVNYRLAHPLPQIAKHTLSLL